MSKKTIRIVLAGSLCFAASAVVQGDSAGTNKEKTRPVSRAGKGSGKAQMTIMEEGKPRATIVVAAQPSKAEQRAARELQRCFWRMASRAGEKAEKLPIVSEDDEIRGPRIFVGRTDRVRKLGLRFDDLADHGFKIRTVGTDLVLCGKDDLGTEYAVYTFLEKYCDVRWFWPGELGEYIPRRRTVRIGQIHDDQEPDFHLVRFGRDHLWRKRNKLVRGPRYSGGHSWGRMIPPAKYGPTHPEYFALVGGTREKDWKGYDGQHGYQLCTTNPEVIRICVEYVRKFFDDHPDVKMYCVGANDGGGFCECDRCVALGVGRASDTKIDRKANPRFLSDRIYAFTNEIAKEIKKTHPDRYLIQLAYSYYADPPAQVRPLDNVIPWLTLNCEGNYDPSYKNKQWDLLQRWSKLCKKLFIYEYFNHTWKLQLPRAMPKVIAEAIPTYRRAGAEMFAAQSGNDFATEGLDFYLVAKLLWDSSLDVQALVDDYCEKAFGRAGAVMKRYFERLEDHWAGSVRAFNPDRHPVGSHEQYRTMFSPEAMTELKGYLLKARKQSQPGQDRQRVEFMLKGWRFAELELEAFRQLRMLAEKGIIRKFGPSGWGGKRVADLSKLAIPESQWRPMIEQTIAAWEERDRYVERCKGQFVIDARMLRAWNCTDYRFHPIEALKKALDAYDRRRSAAAKNVPADIILEIESFELTDAEVKSKSGASGGKVVLFGSPKSRARGSVTLEKGNYILSLYVEARGPDADATYLKITGDDRVYRLWPENWGKISPSYEQVRMTVKSRGKRAITLWAAETGVVLDRIVIEPAR